MKLLLQIAASLLFVSIHLQAQIGRGKLDAAEYYFDVDPGQGAATPLSLDGNLNNALRIAINSASASLSPGLHTINVRLKDSLNNWGNTFRLSLLVENPISSRATSIALARVYWDVNVAGANYMIIVNGNAGNVLNTFINSSPLNSFSSPGLHKLNVQVMGVDGNYSLPFTTMVNVEDELINPRIISAALGRVYWDANVGAASGMIILNGNAGNAINTFVNSASPGTFSLSGLHKLNVQLLDPNLPNNYGPVFTTIVQFENDLINQASIKVIQGRLWLDNDTPPAIGNMLALNGNFDEVIESVFHSLPTPSIGLHILNVQLRDSANGWGPIFKTTVSVEQPIIYRNINVASAEYFWDGNATQSMSMLAFDGNFQDAIETAFASTVISLSPGLHTLHVRVKEVANNFSNDFKTVINVENLLAARNIRVSQGEVSIDANPSAMVVGLNGNFNAALENVQSLLLSNGITPGLHTLNVRLKGDDNNWGKTFTTALVVTPCSSTPVPTVSASGALSFCSGDSIVLSANAGFNSYTWVNANVVVGNSQTLTVKNSGSYTLVVTDTANCPNSPAPIVVNVHQPQVNIIAPVSFCQGSVDSLVAGSGFNSYLWSNGATGSSIFITAAGNYSVTVMDAFGCTVSNAVSVNQIAQPAAPLISLSGAPSFCPGGSVTLTSSISIGIVWNNGLTSPSFTTDTSGYYRVVVTSANGCTNFAEINTLRFPLPQANISLMGPSSFCLNTPSTLMANQGTAYLWSEGSVGSSIQPTQSGNYTVQVTDSNSCIAYSTPFNVVVYPVPPVPVISASGPLSFCNGNSVTLSSSAPFQNLWSNGDTLSLVIVYSSSVISDTVFNQFGCKSYSAALSIDVHPVASISASSPLEFCYGDSVQLNAHPTSGVSYLWQNGATTSSIKLFGTTSASVITTEIIGGCSDTAYASILVNPLPTGNLSLAGPSLVCAGTSVTFNANGSANTKFQWFVNGSPITYWIYSGSCNCYISYNVYGSSYQTTTAGFYSVLIIDTITGCTQFSNQVQLELQSAPQPVISASGGSTICIGTNAILSTALASTYLWSTGATTQSIQAAIQGNYTVTITDNLGCSNTSLSTQVSFYPVASIVSSGPLSICQGESVDLTAQPAGTYLWSNNQTGQTLNNIDTSGVYSVTVTDVNGCTSISPSVLVIVNALPSGSINSNEPLDFCLGESIIINTSGSANTKFQWYFNGSPITTTSYSLLCNCYSTYNVYGYTYLATVQGQYSAKVIDTLTGCSSFTNPINTVVYAIPAVSITQSGFLDCFGDTDASLVVVASGTTGPYNYLWSTGSTSISINNLAVGTYISTVSDVHGCMNQDTITITQPTSVSPQLSSPTTVKGYHISCYGGSDGSISVLSGGTPTYAYSWSNGMTTASISNLNAGTYSVIVTDGNNCTGQSSILLTETPALVLSFNPSIYVGGNNIRCFNGNDGTLNVSAIGGNGLAGYQWSNSSNTVTITDLTSGLYSVTVTDSAACIQSGSYFMTEPTPMVSSVTSPLQNGYSISCFGVMDGSLNVNVSGGTPAYSYLWNDASVLPNRNSLDSGMYFVAITDTNACVINDSIYITSPSEISGITTASTLNCFDDTNGTASINVNGGDPGYSYQWSNGQNVIMATNLSAGYYQVTVSDSRACSKVFQAQVQSPPELIGYAFGTYIDCGTQIGLLSITASGGTEPYSFLWSNGSTASFQSNLPVGNYSVTVTDAHGCTDQANAIILNPPDLMVLVANDSVLCENSSDGDLSVVVSGGVQPYMYLWSNGATTASLNNLLIGTYTVIVTDANGCTAVGTPSVIPIHVIQNQFVINAGCGAAPGIIQVNSTGGMSPYSYLWDTGASTSTINVLNIGYYSVTVTDANFCVREDSIEYQQLQIIASGPTVFCQGDSVTLSVNANGNYLWTNGATTATIQVHESGVFGVSVNGCAASNPQTTLATYCYQTIQLKAFIEGFYLGNGQMIAVLDPLNMPLVCDSVTLDLVDSLTYQIIGSQKDIISTTGNGQFYYPSLLPGRRYYLVLRHRNSIETWSKESFMFLTPATIFDFSTP